MMPSPTTRNLFAGNKLQLTLHRLAYELVENHQKFENTCLIGLQPRGVFLSRQMFAILQQIAPQSQLLYGELDATFHRDDFRQHGRMAAAGTTEIPFLVEGKNVILVDDVLYTGRTVRAALDAMLTFGRPQNVQLLVLVDRKRRRELPIEAKYIGITVDTLASEKVIVNWQSGAIDSVVIQSDTNHEHNTTSPVR